MIEPVSSPEAQIESRSRLRQRRRRFFLAAVLVLLILVVVPPFININRFRRSIVHSISAGLGRPVEASAVELELFPRPGFVLHNLTVGEDPAFGAEPVMMAQTVTAGLRASTLWHARVEIATLRFDAPSVNLVRNPQGRWNFESLLKNSPALQSHGSSASSKPLPFPYVEATDARINFKLGPEKLPFSLERADLAVWKESGHKWRLRIKARPVRTDLTVMDAGQIRGEGTLITEGALWNAPVQASLEWRRVQLDEISRLLHGEDNGWRGTVDWTAHVLGTLADVSLVSDIAVEEFHRAEFIPAREMDLFTHCHARYARNDWPLDSLECDAPVGGGHLLLRGPVRPPVHPPVHQMHGSLHRGIGRRSKLASSEPFQITLQRVPADAFLNLLGHIHPGIAADSTVSGEVNGEANCDWHGFKVLTSCTGEIRSKELRLHLAHLDRPLTLSPFLLASIPSGNHPATVSAASIWRLSPLHVSLGGSTPATLTGAMTSAGPSLQLTGPADLAGLDKLAQSLKIPAFSGEVQSIRGDAQLDLLLESTWLPRFETNMAAAVQPVQFAQPGEFAPSRWTGSLQLHDATLKIATLPRSVQLTSARINLLPAGVEWTGLDGTFAHIPFDGSVQWQTPCPTAKSACARTFALHTPDLNADYLQAALRNSAGSSDLLNLINPWAAGIPQLPEISGTLNADVLSAGRISLKNAQLQLRMEGHSATLTAISGRIFGGTLSGVTPAAPALLAPEKPAQTETGSVHWGDGAPSYTLRATLRHIQPESVAAIWREHWGNGTANLEIDLKTQGWSAAELARNTNGKFTIAWVNGTLSSATAPLSSTAVATDKSQDKFQRINKFQRWDAEGTIRNRMLILGSSQIVPQAVPIVGRPRKHILSPAAQSVAGTISFARTVDLKLEPSGISITGPLNQPTVTPLLKSQTIKHR